MTKLILQTDFLVAYYYHAARDAAKAALSLQPPDSVQNAIVAIIMSQCALEGYINYLIRKYGIASHKVTREIKPSRKPQIKLLADLSVREKWIHVPIIVAGRNWTLNGEPFKYFAELVEHRNDLVHFNSDKFVHEAILPKPLATIDDIKNFVKDGSWLKGSKVHRSTGMGLAGHQIVHDMIHGLHRLLNTDPPSFISADKILYSIKVHHMK